MILRSGFTAEYAIEQLDELIRALRDPRVAEDEPYELPHRPGVEISLKINSYLNWVQTAEQALRNLFTDTELVNGPFGDHYLHIASLPPASGYGHRVITNEIERQGARLNEVTETLKKWHKLGEMPGDLLALDTNSFLQYRPYDEIPWRELRGGHTVRLILTMPTLDEIEAKKQGSNDEGDLKIYTVPEKYQL